jgi:hypothetical protein
LSTAKLIGIEKDLILGSPDLAHVSYVERQSAHLARASSQRTECHDAVQR